MAPYEYAGCDASRFTREQLEESCRLYLRERAQFNRSLAIGDDYGWLRLLPLSADSSQPRDTMQNRNMTNASAHAIFALTSKPEDFGPVDLRFHPNADGEFDNELCDRVIRAVVEAVTAHRDEAMALSGGLPASAKALLREPSGAPIFGASGVASLCFPAAPGGKVDDALAERVVAAVVDTVTAHRAPADA